MRTKVQSVRRGWAIWCWSEALFATDRVYDTRGEASTALADRREDGWCGRRCRVVRVEQILREVSAKRKAR